MKRSPCLSVARAAVGTELGAAVEWISLHGPHGPVSPICQKFSSSPRRWIRAIGTPTYSCQICLGLVVALVDRDPEPVAVDAPASVTSSQLAGMM